jgi:hypothetical protein
MTDNERTLFSSLITFYIDSLIILNFDIKELDTEVISYSTEK